MTEKLDKLSNDIYTFLKNHEPQRFRHHEICDSLFDSYKYNYKNKKSFGVAISQKLTFLKTKRLIIHEDIWYGTFNSKSQIERQLSTEKPNREGLFGWLKDRSERKRLERERTEKEALADQWSAMELIAEQYPEEMGFWKDIAEKEKKNRKELGLK